MCGVSGKAETKDAAPSVVQALIGHELVGSFHFRLFADRTLFPSSEGSACRGSKPSQQDEVSTQWQIKEVFENGW